MISEGADIGEKRQRISDVVGVSSAIANVSADGAVRGVALVGVGGRSEEGGHDKDPIFGFGCGCGWILISGESVSDPALAQEVLSGLKSSFPPR